MGRLTGSDAYIFAPAVDVPLDGLEVRVRWRCDRAGGCQIYWGTDAQPALTEQRQMSRPAATAGQWIEHTFPIGGPEAHGRRLTTFRLDPFNGNRDGTFEIDRAHQAITGGRWRSSSVCGQ